MSENQYNQYGYYITKTDDECIEIHFMKDADVSGVTNILEQCGFFCTMKQTPESGNYCNRYQFKENKKSKIVLQLVKLICAVLKAKLSA